MDLPDSIIIPVDYPQERADKVLSSLLPGSLSRASVAGLIREGRFLREGEILKPSTSLCSGDSIVITQPESHMPGNDQDPEYPPFSVIYEDEFILVLDKPAGVVTHAGAGRPSGVLVDSVVRTRPEIVGVGAQGRWGIVHRLDKDTSGVMVMAKTIQAYKALSARFRDHSIQRLYLALVRGSPNREEGLVDKPLGRHPKNRKKMTTKAEQARNAITRWRVRERFREFTLLEVRPETGRTHQIRVHLASQGIPVAGDQVYGKLKSKRSLLRPESKRAITLLKRQALHAAKLGFEHPVTGKGMEFESDLPEEISKALDILRRGVG